MTIDQIIISCLGSIFTILFGIFSWIIGGIFKKLQMLEDKLTATQILLASDYTKSHDLKTDLVKIENSLSSIDLQLKKLSEEVIRLKVENYVPRDER